MYSALFFNNCNQTFSFDLQVSNYGYIIKKFFKYSKILNDLCMQTSLQHPKIAMKQYRQGGKIKTPYFSVSRKLNTSKKGVKPRPHSLSCSSEPHVKHAIRFVKHQVRHPL